MIALSAKLEYGLLALLELALHYKSQRTIGTGEIAAKQHIPERYLDQILAELKRANLIKSFRGAKGGYILAKAPQEICLFDVMSALEKGSNLPCKDNVLGNPPKVIIQRTWGDVEREMQRVLTEITLEYLLQQCLQCEEPKLMYYI